MSSIVTEAENTAPRFNDTFLEYAQARGFVIDAARIATPTDKACASDYSLLIRSGTKSSRPSWQPLVNVGNSPAPVLAVMLRGRCDLRRGRPLPTVVGGEAAALAAPLLASSKGGLCWHGIATPPA